MQSAESGLGLAQLHNDAAHVQFALNELFDRFYDRVRRIARIRMGSRLQRPTESDDSVQNTFAVAFKKIDQLASRELKEIYDACVQELDPVHLEVILLHEYAEASWATIREALNRPTDHAAQQLYARAQVELATLLRRRLGQ